MGMDNSSLDCEKEFLQQYPVDLARASVCSKAHHLQDKKMIEDEDPTMPEDEVIPEDNEVVPEEDYCEDALMSADTRVIDEIHQDPEAVCYQHQGCVIRYSIARKNYTRILQGEV